MKGASVGKMWRYIIVVMLDYNWCINMKLEKLLSFFDCPFFVLNVQRKILFDVRNVHLMLLDYLVLNV